MTVEHLDVLREDTENPPNIIPSRFILAIKKSDDGSEVYKALFFLGGHRDREKGELVHNSSTLKSSSISLLIAVVTILGFDVWSTDINQAYLQSASELKRDVFIKPDILKLSQDELVLIINPIYRPFRFGRLLERDTDTPLSSGFEDETSS